MVIVAILNPENDLNRDNYSHQEGIGGYSAFMNGAVKFNFSSCENLHRNSYVHPGESHDIQLKLVFIVLHITPQMGGVD